MRDNINKALKYSRECQLDDLEIYIEAGEELSIEIRNGEIDKFQESKSSGVGIRAIKNKKQALVYGTSLDFDELKYNIDKAKGIVEYLDEDEALDLNSEEQYDGIIMEKEINEIAQMPLNEKLSYLKEIEKQGSGQGDLKGMVESSSYDEVIYTRQIINTRGLDKIEKGAYTAAAISLAIEQKGIKETGFSYDYNRDINKLFQRKLGDEAYLKAKEMLGANQVETGKYMVILNNEIVVDLLSLLSSSFSGENLFKGKSLYKDKEGQKIISDLITIVDDGLKEGVLGQKSFDGEGTKTQNNIIIDKGVFKKGIYNLSMAKKSNTKTTGNCSRSYSSFPGIGYNSLSIEAGDGKVEKWISNLDQGIIVKELMGLHMANPITGEFSLGASGLVIKNGKISNGFRGVTISGNLNDIFNQIVEIGSDFEYKGTKGAPSLLVKDVILSGS